MTQERERENDVGGDVVEVMKESQKELLWKKRGRGRGLRWLLLRDICAILSLRPMTIAEIQDTMTLHRGISRSKTREFLEVLESTRSVEQIQEEIRGLQSWMWRTTDQGIAFWLEGSRLVIPATIAKVAWTIKPAWQYGVKV